MSCAATFCSVGFRVVVVVAVVAVVFVALVGFISVVIVFALLVIVFVAGVVFLMLFCSTSPPGGNQVDGYRRLDMEYLVQLEFLHL